MDQVELASLLAEAAREIGSVRDVDEVLSTIVHVAVSSLPGIDHAGISLVHSGGRVETRAGTGELVWALDALQYELGEGPCLDALVDGEPDVIVVNRLRHEQRWPRYVRRALDHGIRAQMGIRLFNRDRVYGGLNLYATSTEEIDPVVEGTARLLAAHATLALGHARREADLNAALSSRERIGQAVGIVMQRYAIDSDTAFTFLVRTSQSTNTKLRDIAEQIVNGRDPAELGPLSDPSA